MGLNYQQSKSNGISWDLGIIATPKKMDNWEVWKYEVYENQLKVLGFQVLGFQGLSPGKSQDAGPAKDNA